MSDLPYLRAYPPAVLDQVRELIATGRLPGWLARKYPARHDIQTDRALYDYVNELRLQYLRHATPLSKVMYDGKLDVIRHALGTHTFVSRVQGGKLKAKNEIRVAGLLREAPPELLRMIVVHELAHFRHKDHDKAFYQLCCHMEPDYHQLEFDLRLWLTARELG